MRSTPSTCIVSSILAVALAAAPTHVALAAGSAPAAEDEEAEPADEGDDEAEPASEDAEDREGDEADDGEGDDGEGEDGEDEPEEEPEPADEGDEEAEASDEPPAPAFIPPEDERPDEPLIAGKPRKGKGLMIAGGSVLGLGIVSTSVFGAVSRHCSYSGPLQCRHQNDAEFMIPLGLSVTLLGAMMLAVGIGYHFHYKKWERWTPGQNDKRKRRRAETALVPSLGRSSAGLSWAGRF
jgi:hypothetical protein